MTDQAVEEVDTGLDGPVAAAMLELMRRHVAPNDELDERVGIEELCLPLLMHASEEIVRRSESPRARARVPGSLSWAARVRIERLRDAGEMRSRLHRGLWQLMGHDFVRTIMGRPVPGEVDLRERVDMWLEGEPGPLADYIVGAGPKGVPERPEPRMQALGHVLLPLAIDGADRARQLYQLVAAYARLVTPWTTSGVPHNAAPDVVSLHEQITQRHGAGGGKGDGGADRRARRHARELESRAEQIRKLQDELVVEKERSRELRQHLAAEQELVADLRADLDNHAATARLEREASSTKDEVIGMLHGHVADIELDQLELAEELREVRASAIDAQEQIAELQATPESDRPVGIDGVARWLDDELKLIINGPEAHLVVRADGKAGRRELERAHADLRRAIEHYLSRTRRRLPPRVRASAMLERARIRVLGGGDAIGASCIVVEAGDRRVMVDAGIRWSRSLADIGPAIHRLGPVDAIVATHGHNDHVGFLPAVVRRESVDHGRAGVAPVIGTAATRRLTSLALAETERQLRNLAGVGDNGELLAVPPWDGANLAQVGQAWRSVELGSTIEVTDGLSVTLHQAGHYPGAASVLVEHADCRTLVSGDVATFAQRTVGPADWSGIGDVDVLVLESTLGSGDKGNVEVDRQLLIAELRRCLERGGDVIIPAYATGLAQEVAALVDAGVAAGELPARTQLVVDGSIVAGIEAYRSIGALEQSFASVDYLPITSSGRRDEHAVPRPDDPRVIVATSGRGEVGPVTVWIERLGPARSTQLLLPGGSHSYQNIGESRRGGSEQWERSITILVEGVPRRVELGVAPRRFYLSSHAGLEALLDLADLVNPSAVVPVHGNARAIANLVAELRARGHQVLPVRDGAAINVEG